MLKRAWKPLAASAAGIGAGTYAYNRYFATRPTRVETFDLRVRDPSTGEMITRKLPLIAKENVDKRIRENATATTWPSAEGLLWKHTTANLASNDPIEDANARAIVRTEASADSPAGDLLFMAVMDGHGGPRTSAFLVDTLIPAVICTFPRKLNQPQSKADVEPWYSVATSIMQGNLSPDGRLPVLPTLRADIVPDIISTAFLDVDAIITQAPFDFLKTKSEAEWSKEYTLPDLSQDLKAGYATSVALSGSCALMAMLDTARRDLYVACTGDCRAVAGYWDEAEDGTGKWRVEVLSEDQTGRNPSELKRIQSEHPPEEVDDVIRRGRVLGGLEPTRAFGDARYKWPLSMQEAINKVYFEGAGKSMRPPPPSFKTPPYVTALPVVTHRKLDIPSPSSPSTSKSSLRFIVLATDGLWDELSSSEVVSLVAGHLSGLRGPVPRSQLPSLVPLDTESGSRAVEGKDQTRLDAKRNTEGSWAFIDDNVSAHLIRNALGGGDEGRVRRSLSIPPGVSRRYRDDITVTVLWYEPAPGPGPQGEGPIKAKL